MTNNYTNRRIEYHILQSFPVTCLNRDDVGAPKTAIVGGVTRARVSSQCWKRQVRMALRESGMRCGVRTKHVEKLLYSALSDEGASEDQATQCAEKIAKELVDDTLLFLSDRECQAFAKFAAEKEFKADAIKVNDISKVAKKIIDENLDALDIALFGRMVAKAADMNVEAAASFSHAISTHKVANELDFFTALDDLGEEPGSAHMGTLEFNSATYYRYVCLDLGQLVQTLGDSDLKKAVEAFTKALFVAIPAARQTTQSGACPWEFARVYVRAGQRLQVPFDKPVRANGHGYLEPSISELRNYLDTKEKLWGDLFSKEAMYEWGQDSSYNINALINDLCNHVEK
ncbi:MAG: type I-E CRISPR-associated protein Cas7/Cse4/CasC [Candidatus Dadabacteria bacterium]|nr:MAG: type I-E CRISPR-associated protein Cas7/Cse4/CasC [Candidatus Dadabacteria bacterium]